uniref:Exosome complex exonuclease RRP41like protein putati n=1 Tax=Albugo laibachii Nc14 TaxID=890382 RepID=F0WQG6_9STRA|nr:exosome complex exonuclease RRP41like protein putati [Albugo laibachii Nc14]|eukprot:CCA23575.1 exosome complex exonuclease RRP41like protein putati [Albugo laibachii Nc14]
MASKAGAIDGEYISLAGLRLDGRREAETRRVRARLGVFHRADGSAYIEQGNTKVLVVVYGPREVDGTTLKNAKGAASLVKKAIVHCECTQASFATSDRKVSRNASDRKNVEMSSAIKQIFESCIFTNLYPQSQISIYPQVLQADGGELAASINATSLALMDAGIALNDFVVASTAGFVQQKSLCDLNAFEQAARGPQITVAINPRSRHVNYLKMEAKLALEVFESVMGMAINGCDRIGDSLQQVVRGTTRNKVQKREIRIL